MKHNFERREGKGAFEIVEEAIHLLRTAPVSLLLSYYIGSVPFILGLLYFWAEMSRSALAQSRLETSALGLALLFCWMKGWQSLFARQLRFLMTRQPASSLSWRQTGAIFLSQSILQPSGLFLLPVALVLTIPFGWVYAFYQNLSALADGQTDLKSLVKAAAAQSMLRPHQNHSILALLLGFSLVVFLNWVSVCGLSPHLVKMLLGIESVFTRSGPSYFNTTFFMSMVGLTYLTVDPILKAVYALRCFYGLSLKSGEDLQAELRGLGGWQSQVIAVLVLGCCCALAQTPATASTPEPSGNPPKGMTLEQPRSAQPSGVSPQELDKRIDHVLEKRKYAWRMPRERLSESREKGVIARFLERVAELFRKWAASFGKWLENLLRRIFSRPWQPGSLGTAAGWAYTLKLLLLFLAALVLGGLLILLYRVWQRHGPRMEPVPSEPVLPVPDLTSENIGPDQLPEDGWMKLAEEMLEKGELRLALRAMYLASLVRLAERNLLTLAGSKSNLEYFRELARRGHAFPSLQELFRENLAVFERIWYGMHEVTQDLVSHFAENVRKMKEGVS